MYMSSMAKQLSNAKKISQAPFGDDSCVNFDEMTLDSFRLWSAAALKVYLSIRKRSTEGSYDELVAR